MPDIKKDIPNNPNVEKGPPGKNIDVEKEKQGMGEDFERKQGQPPSEGEFEKQGSSEDKGYTHK